MASHFSHCACENGQRVDDDNDDDDDDGDVEIDDNPFVLGNKVNGCVCVCLLCGM